MLLFRYIVKFCFEDFGFINILIDDKSQENILIYDISYKTLNVPKPLRIRFDKSDRCIRVYDGTRYLTLFDSQKYDATCNRIRYLISLTSSITYLIPHYDAKSWFLWLFTYRNKIDCNGTRTHNHLVNKRTFNHLTKLVKWLGCIVSTYLYIAFT